MFKTFIADRPTIEIKYHMPDKPGDANRFNYHGYDYDPTTGLSDAAMDEGVAKLAAELDAKAPPRPIHKAKMFEYVLDNTQIDVNEHDYFIGLRAWGRVTFKHTVQRWSLENREKYPEEHEICRAADRSGASYGGLDFDHTVPDWDAILNLGFKGLLDRATASYEKIKRSGKLTEKQENFYHGIVIEYEAIIRFIDRLYKYALSQSHEKAPKIAECLKHLRDGAPTDFYEALQCIYLYFMLSESVDIYQVRSLGFGLDQSLYPYFIHDLESGKYTRNELGEFLAYFLMQWQAMGNYWGQPIYLSGSNPDGTTKVNELTYLILDVYDTLGLFNPKVQIKVYKSTPKDLIIKALDMIRRGNSSIVFINGDMVTKCLMANGASYEEALDSVISGCYEYKVRGRGVGIGGVYYNMLKGVSMVFDNGVDTTTGLEIGLKTGELESLTTFDKFYDAYLAQTKHMLLNHLFALNEMAKTVGEVNPSLMFSATLKSCAETLTDALDNGTDNGMGYLTSGFGTAIDALMAVKELVYDQKAVTLAEMKAALDADWVGYEALRSKALNLKCKYGNGNEIADNYAAALLRFVYDLTAGKTNSHGGEFAIEMHSARAFIVHGGKTKATPDGRKMGMETSKNASPTPGADRNGITALIKSATTLDTSLCTIGFCLDAMLHPSAVQGDDGLNVLYSVVDTYFKKNGQSIHFNIFDTETLRDAQKHPERYKNLQVRVCGWNVLWNDMAKSEQDAYILRAENIQR